MSDSATALGAQRPRRGVMALVFVAALLSALLVMCDVPAAAVAQSRQGAAQSTVAAVDDAGVADGASHQHDCGHHGAAGAQVVCSSAGRERTGGPERLVGGLLAISSLELARQLVGGHAWRPGSCRTRAWPCRAGRLLLLDVSVART